MKAKCINDESYQRWLTKGKIYEVAEKVYLNDDCKYFSVIDTDNGENDVVAFQARFVVVKNKNKKEIKADYKSLYTQFTREELRDYAKQIGVEVGRDKKDTAMNLYLSNKVYFKIELTTEVKP